MNRVALAACAALLSALFTHAARAATTVYVLAIGYNGAPPTAAPAVGEAPLRYADDDAAAFYRFTRAFRRGGRLLTLMDADTQSRFPAEVAEARPPTLSELRAEVRDLREALESDRARGDDPIVFFFYSGHGTRPRSGLPALTLLDGSLTHDVLYDEVLSALPARYVHVFIDACYAEAVVRPRDAEAAAAPLSDAEIARSATQTTLARFPNTGAIVASSIASQTHEWDVYRHGVFTHELLSGLRGAADVNVDGKIEYSELDAFLSAANRDVADARARLSVVARAPSANSRVPIVDLGALKSMGRISDIPSSAGPIYLEDHLGNRLADAHVENGAKFALTLPAEETIYVRSRAGEAEIVLHTGQTVPFDHLQAAPPVARVRGALDVAMRRGLFTTGFGPNYYRGFVDRTSGFVSVPFDEGEPPHESDVARAEASRPGSAGKMAFFTGAGPAGGVANGLGPLVALRVGLVPGESSGFTFSVDGAWGRDSAFYEGRLLGSAGYRVGTRKDRWTAFAELDAGGGAAVQAARGGRTDTLSTGILFVAPGAGVSFRLSNRFSVALHGMLLTMGFRRDGALAAAALPTAYLGLASDL